MESDGEPKQSGAPHLLEVLDSYSWGEDNDESTITPKSSPLPRRKTSVSSDDSEPEPPSVILRKVSFADAFGLDLVSVKEFDTWDVPIKSFSDSPEGEAHDFEEYFLSSWFTLPSSHYELMQKVYDQKVELESIEFLPGLTSMKGVIRVLNVSFKKLVYVRMTLDAWNSFYDLLAEYIPGSSDGETDQFSFKICLVPPYQKEGAKIEFCIRYETSAGTFWANNNGANYTLCCNKKEVVREKQQEENSNKNKKSCLKTISKENVTEVNDTVVHAETPGTANPEREEAVGESSETPVQYPKVPRAAEAQLEILVDNNLNITGMKESREVLRSSDTQDHYFPGGTEAKQNPIPTEEQGDISTHIQSQDPEISTSLSERTGLLLEECVDIQTNNKETTNQKPLINDQIPLLSLHSDLNKDDILPLKQDDKEAFGQEGKEDATSLQPLEDQTFNTYENDVLDGLVIIEEEGVTVCETDVDVRASQSRLLNHTPEITVTSAEVFIVREDIEAASACTNRESQSISEQDSKAWAHIETEVNGGNSTDQPQSNTESPDATGNEIPLDRGMLRDIPSIVFETASPAFDDTAHYGMKQEVWGAIQENVKELTCDKEEMGRQQDTPTCTASSLEIANAYPQLPAGVCETPMDELSIQYEAVESIAAQSPCGTTRVVLTEEEEIVSEDLETPELKQGDLQIQVLQDRKQNEAAGEGFVSDWCFEHVESAAVQDTGHIQDISHSSTIAEQECTDKETMPNVEHYQTAEETLMNTKRNGKTPEELEMYSFSAETEREPELPVPTHMLLSDRRTVLDVVQEEEEEKEEEKGADEGGKDKDINTDHRSSITGGKMDSRPRGPARSSRKRGAFHHASSHRRERHSTLSPFLGKRSIEDSSQNLRKPVILISQPACDKSESESEDEDEALREDQAQAEDSERHPGKEQAAGETTEYEGRNDLINWNGKLLGWHHVSKELIYLILFIIFLVTAYHYDFMACFVLYIFSVYWLCCQKGKQGESFARK